MRPRFHDWIKKQPRLGIGISAEFNARPSIRPLEFAQRHPGLIEFVEYGTEATKGLDVEILRWVDAGGAATYHFLDLNVEEDEDLDAEWLTATSEHARRIKSPWLCGDAGLWHFGPRDRGHGLLLPPIYAPESAALSAANLSRLMERTELMVLPETPPALHPVGEMHMLEWFAEVVTRADTGLVLDAAHLAIYQRQLGLDPCHGLAAFPVERVVEVHVAGGSERHLESGFRWIEDDHKAHVLQDTWTILETMLPRANALKAIVFECEHNAEEDVVDGFRRLHQCFPRGGAP